MPSSLKVLWATDGSEASLAALPILKSLVLPRARSLHVLTVAPKPLISGARPDPVYFKPWSAAEKKLALQAAEEIARDAAESIDQSGLDIQVEARFGQPINEILRAAQALKPDLIVLGAKGHSDLRLMLLGSVAQGVTLYARRPVLIVRPGAHAVQTIVAGIDGSPVSRKALRFIECLALPEPARLILARAVQLIPLRRSLAGNAIDTYTAEVIDINARTTRDAKRDLVAAGNLLADAPLDVEHEMPEGKAGLQLIRLAEERNADLILVGSRMPSRARRYLLGSTAELVTREASTSVLVVR